MDKKVYFIDIVYYTCYKIYNRYEKDLNEFSAQVLTSVCLSCNIIVILISIQEIYKISFFESKWNALFVLIPILLINYIRYNKFVNVVQIGDALHHKKSKKKRLIVLSLLYIIISIFGFLIFAIILGELNNPPPFWDNWFS